MRPIRKIKCGWKSSKEKDYHKQHMSALQVGARDCNLSSFQILLYYLHLQGITTTLSAWPNWSNKFGERIVCYSDHEAKTLTSIWNIGYCTRAEGSWALPAHGARLLRDKHQLDLEHKTKNRLCMPKIYGWYPITDSSHIFAPIWECNPTLSFYLTRLGASLVSTSFSRTQTLAHA
jgi:hypothetical protein